MSPLHHRAPGVVGAALDAPGCWCGLIVDNAHLHPATVRIAINAKGPERIMLVTDAMRRQNLSPHVLSEGDAASAMYWSAAQIVAHHSSNGCILQPGDLIGTGTLSTASPRGLGSLLEISQGGKTPLTLASGETRSFLEDGDELTLAARCEAPGAVPIGLGHVTGRILPAFDG